MFYTFVPLSTIKTDNNTLKGAIAQLVEQRTENPCVAGSNPAGTTKNLDNLFEVFYYPSFL